MSKTQVHGDCLKKNIAALICMAALIGMMLSACKEDDQHRVIRFSDSTAVESVVVNTYDFDNDSMIRHWTYRGDELEAIGDRDLQKMILVI